jgi:Tfp pilus assembly protein PilX
MKHFRRLARRTRLAAQRGVVGVVALLFIIVIVIFAMTQASNIGASNTMDSSRQLDAVEALFLAESAVEYAGYKFVSNATPTCDDTNTGVGTTVSMGRGSWTILSSATTSFTGAALVNSNYCRVRVQGTVTASGVTRTLETIVGTENDVISISSLNPNFNNITYTGNRANDGANPPEQWTLTGGTQGLAYIAWDKNGGPDGTRSAFARKTVSGSGTASSGGAFQVPSATPILITVPRILRLTFDYRVWTRGNSQQEMQFSPRLVFDTCPSSGTPCVSTVTSTYTAGGACDANGTVGWCESGPTASGSPRQSNGQAPNGCGYIDTACWESGPADATCPGYVPTSAGTYANCSSYVPPSGSSGYETGNLTYSVPATTDPSGKVKLTSISMSSDDSSGRIRGKDGQITWIWIDNLRLSVPSVSGGGPSKMWREVAAP